MINIGTYIKKNAASILTGASIAGFFATIGITVHETLKIAEEIEPDMPKKQKRKIVIKHGAPIVASALATTSCIIGSNVVSEVTNAKYLTAAVGTGEAYRNLQKAVYDNCEPEVVEKIKEEEYLEAYDCGIGGAESDPIPDWHNTYRFYLPELDLEFETTFGNLMAAMYEMNNTLRDDTGIGGGRISLGQLMEMIDAGSSNKILFNGDEALSYGWSIGAGEEFYGYASIRPIFYKMSGECAHVHRGATIDEGDYYVLSFSFPPTTDYMEF